MALAMATPSLAFHTVQRDLTTGSNSSPTVMFVHGILSSGRQFLKFGEQLVKRLGPEWRVVCVDLRNHGNSSTLPFPPPHNLGSSATDIASLIENQPDLQPDILIGHSMGGRIVMEFVKLLAKDQKKTHQKKTSDRSFEVCKLPKEVWVLDTFISNTPGWTEMEKLKAILPGLPPPASIPSRLWMKDRLEEMGLSDPGLTSWLVYRCLTQTDGVFHWTFDLEGALEMFRSCPGTNYWSLLENPPENMSVGVVCGSESGICVPRDKVRLQDLADCGKIRYKTLDNAGHALHVDNPSGLLEFLTFEQ